MEQYIPKAIVVAEIERRAKALHSTLNEREIAVKCELKDFLSFLDTLEVKEVDLDKLLTGFMSRYAYENGGEYPSAIEIAKHFFELGIKEAQKGK